MKHNRHLFSMIELMMTMTIILIVMGISLSTFVYIKRTTNEARCRSQIKVMELAFERFRRDNKYYYQKNTVGPLGLADYNQLVDRTTGNDFIDFDGLQFSTDETYGYVDPWGNPFYYQSPGTMNDETFDLFTFGIDGQPGEAGVDDDGLNGIDDAAEAQSVSTDYTDDINNWTKR